MNGSGRHFYSVDFAKAIAAFLVVCVHIPLFAFPQSACGTVCKAAYYGAVNSAVPIFFALSGFLLQTRVAVRQHVFPGYLKKILLITAFWYLFYLVAVDVVELLRTHAGFLHSREMFGYLLRKPHGLLLNGTYYHLWFFPSLVSSTALLFLFTTRCRPRTVLVAAGLLYCAGMLGQGYGALLGGPDLHVDTRNGPMSGFLFMAMGFYFEKLRKVRRGCLRYIALGLVVSTAENALLLSAVHRLPLYGLGSVVLVFGLLHFICNEEIRKENPLARIGRYSLGLYALHPFLIYLYGRAGLNDYLLPLAKACIVYGLALLLTIELRNHTRLRTVL
ncbi:acyltransferase 3 [Desulfovibrio sp. X2]|uniref:acyltransferase n=1 Tax=Desulfovibrio sp. X2 TaxID=941449 RepID=UPI000358CCB1|nr:acyltransferase [Desulfovibrio sp. X2]EPR43353.1 acyltransferase 3 [Desulfovibrio sp. X2]